MTADGQLRGVPRDPDLILTLECTLVRVLDLTVPDIYADLGTSAKELVSAAPSRFILNARKATDAYTATRHGLLSQWQNLCPEGSERPKTQKGYCLDIFIESLVIGERVEIRDNSGRLKAEINGWIPKPPPSPS